MNDENKLEQLKIQILNTSNKRYEVKYQKEMVDEEIKIKSKALAQKENEINQTIKNLLYQSEMETAKERELLQDKLDRFSYRQTVMNEQLINLNENLTDTTALESLYKTKRDELEQCFQEEKESLKRQIKSLTEHLESLKEEISTKTSKIEEIQKDLKKNEFLYNVKRIICDKWLAIGLAGLVIVFIGGFFGWAIYDFFHWLMFDVVFEFYNKIYNKI